MIDLSTGFKLHPKDSDEFCNNIDILTRVFFDGIGLFIGSEATYQFMRTVHSMPGTFLAGPLLVVNLCLALDFVARSKTGDGITIVPPDLSLIRRDKDIKN